MEMLANGSIDGFILSISKETQLKQDFHHFHETINQGMPIVMFDRVVNDVKCDKVIVDDFKGSKKAVSKLLENGCKNVGLITTMDYVSVGKLRTQGYLESLEDRGIQPKSELILKVVEELDSEDHLEDLEAEVEQLFTNNPEIDGVFAVNELYALTAMKVAKKMGKSIPEELQVIGFTDGVLSKHATPSLSTIKQHAEEMGAKSAELLIDRLELEKEDDRYETVVLETELILRESTK